MLLLIDSGNTAISYGIHPKSRPEKYGSLKIDEIPKLVRFCLSSGANKHINIVISSVVPKNINIIKKAFSKLRPSKILIAGKNLPVIIRSKYKNYKRLGIDRKVNIYGALKLHKPPFLIIDAGTGITVDYVSSKGVFEGGLIIPGPGIAFDALMAKTALLPKRLTFPKKSITLTGKTTCDGMSSGILEGYGAMLEGLVSKYRKKYGKKLKTILTGGYATRIKPYARLIDIVDPKLGLKALHLLYKNLPR